LNTVKDLRRALEAEVRRLEPAPGLEARVLRNALPSPGAAKLRPGRFMLPRRGMQLVAAVVLIALALATVAAFLAINTFLHRNVPVLPFGAASGTCSQGFHMTSEQNGWQGAWSYTRDGGTTWNNSSVPTVSGTTKGGGADCELDSSHAWMTVAIGPPPSSTQNGPPLADHLLVLITTDGGRTWQRGGSVPAHGALPVSTLEFINSNDGWILVDLAPSWDVGNGKGPAQGGRTRALYETSDGGYTWSRVDMGSALDGYAQSCGETGLTFTSAELGWLTWDCNVGYGPAMPSQVAQQVVVATRDGGKTWAAVHLPSLPSGEGWICGAKAPVFTQQKGGVMPVMCGGVGHNGWAGVYRTEDGYSWQLGTVPRPWIGLSQMQFLDADTGFAFVGASPTTNDLYMTRDAGQHWTVIARNVFPGQSIESFQFISPTTGFALTSTSYGTAWKTTDGGKTWTLPGHRTLPGDIGCPNPTTPSTGTVPAPVLMASASTGWATGALRTTDGGRHWAAAGPPSLADRSSGTAEFYLDTNHSWVAETAGSDARCADHIVVFATADGGRTWTGSAPISVPVAHPTDSIWSGTTSNSPTAPIMGRNMFLDFVNADDGWMLPVTTSPGIDMMSMPSAGSLYRTTDGGLHWTIVYDLPKGVPTGTNTECWIGPGWIAFSSPTTGWMSGSGCGANGPILRVTHDGGVTWSDLANRSQCNCQGGVPVFFDSSHAIEFAGFQLLITSDGGATWTSEPAPGTFAVWAVGFTDPKHGWAVTADAGDQYQLKRTADGGQTWTLVDAGMPAPTNPGNQNLSLIFVDAQNGFWATGSAIYRTSDGGRTWHDLQAVSS
jgi:photosystem II stability/assembly factor-like uncharacterized protein